MSKNQAVISKGILIITAIMALMLFALFHNGILGDNVLNSNDGPLGTQAAQYTAYPEMFKGGWNDLNWLGANLGVGGPTITPILVWILGPLGFSKLYTPLGLLFFGLCAWTACRLFKLNPYVAGITAIAAALNMNYFSHSAWGLASRATSGGAALLAIGLAYSSREKFSWPKVILAGFCVGLSVMEGADNGTIFAIYVGIFVGVLFLVIDGIQGAVKKIGKIAALVLAAALLASPVVLSLMQTQIKNSTVSETAGMTPAAQWFWATQWSIPKMEALRVIIPGLFGYQMNTQDGSQYWGTVARTEGWEQTHQGVSRHTGSGEYAGVAVVLLALLAIAFAFKKEKSPFSGTEKKVVIFFGAAAFIALLCSFGKHAPFYRLVYSLPYFSSIRNPMKFMHPFHLSVLILFAFGLEGVARSYLTGAAESKLGFIDRIGNWWRTARGFDRRLGYSAAAIFGLSLIVSMIYGASKLELGKYLELNGFSAEESVRIVSFSIHEVSLFLIFLGLSLALIIALIAGAFPGRKSAAGLVLLGALITADLARADLPWVQFYNYKARYARNPVVDFLQANTREYRATQPRFLNVPQAPFFPGVYAEWLGHLFQSNNVQSLDVVQLPRTPLDYEAFMYQTFTNAGQYPRLWQLTSTRWILSPTALLPDINQQLGHGKEQYKIALKFDLANGEGNAILAVTNGPGNFAVMDYTAALPRARVYTSWVTETSDKATLQKISDPSFDPASQVVVNISSLPGSADPKLAEGSAVTYEAYAPKRILLKVHAAAPGVLLLNDKYDPDWMVSVDGVRKDLLRCNYLMRGVQISAGDHQVLFEFKPSLRALYVSLCATLLGVALCGFLLVSKLKEPEIAAPAAPTRKK